VSMIRYQWRDGARYRVDPGSVGQAIEELGARLGKPFDGVTPADVVDEARSHDSPLHPLFTWDDGVAGEKYRQHQAGAVMRSLRVVRVGEAESTPRRFMVAVRPELADGTTDVRAYITLDKVARDAALHRQAVDDAIAGMNAWRSRVAEIKGAEKAAVMIDRAIAALQKLRVDGKAAKPVPAAAGA